jgi:uncharacterized protein YoxC
MEAQLPVTLQVVLYVVCAAIVLFVAVAIPLLFRLERQLERAVSSIEEIKAEAKPLARETRELVDELRGLSGRATRLVEEVGSVVEPPLLASSLGFRLIRTGVRTFVRALWNGTREQQRKARWV